MTVTKAVACVIRQTQGVLELLIFEHPDGTLQLPKGTVEVHEAENRAVVRELEEESGITGAHLYPELARIERSLPSGPTSDGPLEDQVWHVFLFEASSDLPDTCAHIVTDGPTEAGLEFSFRWTLLSQAQEQLDPLFGPVMEVLLQAEYEPSRLDPRGN